MKHVVVIACLALAAFVMLGSEGCGVGGPTDELQVRWANAACESHGGVADLHHWDGDDDPANVRCKDGQGFIQEARPNTEWEFERPIEVRERAG